MQEAATNPKFASKVSYIWTYAARVNSAVIHIIIHASQVAATNPKFASKVSYSLTYDVRINSSAPPLSITSPSHNDVLKSTIDDSSAHISASKEGAQFITQLLCDHSTLSHERVVTRNFGDEMLSLV